MLSFEVAFPVYLKRALQRVLGLMSVVSNNIPIIQSHTSATYVYIYIHHIYVHTHYNLYIYILYIYTLYIYIHYIIIYIYYKISEGLFLAAVDVVSNSIAQAMAATMLSKHQTPGYREAGH